MYPLDIVWPTTEILKIEQVKEVIIGPLHFNFRAPEKGNFKNKHNVADTEEPMKDKEHHYIIENIAIIIY